MTKTYVAITFSVYLKSDTFRVVLNDNILPAALRPSPITPNDSPIYLFGRRCLHSK